MRCRLRAPGACVCAGQGTVPGWMPQHNVQRDLALRASVAQRFRRWECTACRRGPALTGRSVALYHKMHTGAATTFRRVDEASAPAPCCRDRHAVWHPGGSSECRAEDKARRLPHKQQRLGDRDPRARPLRCKTQARSHLAAIVGVAAMDPVLVQGLRDMKSLLDDGILTQVAAREDCEDLRVRGVFSCSGGGPPHRTSSMQKRLGSSSRSSSASTAPLLRRRSLASVFRARSWHPWSVLPRCRAAWTRMPSQWQM